MIGENLADVTEYHPRKLRHKPHLTHQNVKRSICSSTSPLPKKMRSVLTLGRLCLRPIPRIQPTAKCRLQLIPKRPFTNGRGAFRSPPRSRGLLLATAAALSPAAFVLLSEKDNEGTEQTSEGRMLQASREEIAKKVHDDERGFLRFRHNVVFYLDLYIWEPLCTGLRFLHLVVIFVPVLVSIPALWIGPRDKKRGFERSGTLWWYWFLVKSMERAGPAFIKVGFTLRTTRN